MSTPVHQVLEAARVQAHMSFDDLWLAYFALGGAAPPSALRPYLLGRITEVMEYDVLAQALNERFLDRDENHPVPYRDELT